MPFLLFNFLPTWMASFSIFCSYTLLGFLLALGQKGYEKWKATISLAPSNEKDP